VFHCLLLENYDAKEESKHYATSKKANYKMQNQGKIGYRLEKPKYEAVVLEEIH
jgi:hypothetical protein